MGRHAGVPRERALAAPGRGHRMFLVRAGDRRPAPRHAGWLRRPPVHRRRAAADRPDDVLARLSARERSMSLRSPFPARNVERHRGRARRPTDRSRAGAGRSLGSPRPASGRPAGGSALGATGDSGVELALPGPTEPSPIERALAWMERRHGVLSIDGLAAHAGLSPRQMRRVCLERAGLTPKFLARVLRFRHALGRLAASRPHASGAVPGTLAGLALDCGYYDQAHFIHEFREFSGRTPAAHAARPTVN